MKVLIVDDSEGLRKVLAALLTSAGHQVVASLADGKGVEDVVQREKPDCICLDYQLPGRNGLEILAAIHAQAPGIDVLFMTAANSPEIEAQAADAGAAGFIHKPFSQQQLIDELAAVTAARQVANMATETTAAPESAEVPEAHAAAVSPGGIVRRTTVIADDSGSVRLVLKGLLEDVGLRVVQSVGNGAEALNALRTHRPALLCLDVNMPVMSGMEALEATRGISPDTAVVMVTGCADQAFVTQAAALGACGYILKPLWPAYVEALLKRLFA
jgi:CheY-like chemotaxis protein